MVSDTAARAGAPPSHAGPASGPSWPVRDAVVCCLLVAACVVQRPGQTVPDTKLDLVVDPWGFLGRALAMWDPEGYGGQVQNQAAGYLFPIGPFFGLGRLLQVPPWLVQRLWWAVVLVAAYLGVVLLCRALRVGSPASRLLAGLAYALSPHALSTLGAISVEILPYAVAPWAVLPLVGAGRRRSVRRAAALSALAVLCMGGVNAAAVLGGVLPAVAWLAVVGVREAGWRLPMWWLGCTALATAWWSLPLVLLGGYAADFLSYSESAAFTTSVTSWPHVVRGTSHWVPFLLDADGPLRPAGWQLLTSGWAGFAAMAVAVVGLAGLARADLRHRRFLVVCAVSGLLLVGAGHVGALDSPLSATVRALLEGPLAPLRNVHKLDPLLRLALVLGLAHAVGSLRVRSAALTPAARQVATGLVGLLVLVAAQPLATPGLAAGAGFSELPGYWRGVARYLDAVPSGGRTLVLPGAQFGTYTWGDPRDEPLQPLASTPWEVRDAGPLVPEGHIRLLDALDREVRAGRGSSGLADLLARSGISRVVVRNDLDQRQADAPRPLLVAQALSESEGLRQVASFGPRLTVPELPVAFDQELVLPFASVEVYEVEREVGPVSAARLSGSALVVGGSETLLPLLERGLPADTAVVLAADRPAGLQPGRTVLTDGLQRREVDFGSSRHPRSAVLAPDDPTVLPKQVREYRQTEDERFETVARYEGVASVGASSSLSDADAGVAAVPGTEAFAAVDGDPTTSWVSGQRPAGAVGQWLELRFTDAVPVDAVDLTLDPARLPAVTSVRVRTDAGEVVRAVTPGGPQTVPLPPSRTTTLRVTADATADGGPGTRLAVSELRVPGVEPARTRVLPDVLEEGTVVDRVSVTADGPGRPACPRVGGRPLCATGLAEPGGEEAGLDRAFTLQAPGRYAVRGTAVPAPGPELDELLTATTSPGVRVLASSSAVADPLGGPASVFDGDAGTGWVADPLDPSPTLVLGWLGQVQLDAVGVFVDQALAATAPTRVTVRWPGGEVTGEPDSTGRIALPGAVTDQLTLVFSPPELRTSLDPAGPVRLGLGVSEIGLSPLAGRSSRVPAETPVALPCGTTPSVVVDGREARTTARATVGDLERLRPVPLEVCGGPAVVGLAEGEHRLVAQRTPAFTAGGIDLVRVGSATSAGAVPVSAGRWDAQRRSVAVPARAEPVVLVVHENANPGWRARLDGRELEPVRQDGWQQGWLVPAGAAGQVELDYPPGRWYAVALGLGAVGVLAVLAAAVMRDRVPDRPRPPAETAGVRWSRPLRALLALAVLGLLAGAGGVLIGVAVLLLQRLSRGLVTGPAVALLAGTAAAVALGLGPWAAADYRGDDAWVSALVVTAFVPVLLLGRPGRARAAAAPAAPGSAS